MEKEEKKKQGRIIFLFCVSFLPHTLEERKRKIFTRLRIQLDR